MSKPGAALMGERMIVFGGSFNPVHLGHLIMAEDAREQFQADRVLFVPAAQPPHKPAAALAAPEHRIEMLRLAVQDHAAFSVSDLEIRRGGVSYSVDTVEHLRRERPDRALLFLVGGDTLPEIHLWRDVYRLLDLCEVITLVRPGYPPDRLRADGLGLREPWASRLARGVATGHQVDIASSEIRQRIATGRSIRYLVPPAVERYIRVHHLYEQGV